MRTDWLLSMVETMANEVVGTATFMARRWLHTSVIVLIATLSSSLSSVSPSLWIRALLAHCWSFFKGGRSADAVGLLRTASVNGLDQVKRSLLQSGPVVLEILLKASPMSVLVWSSGKYSFKTGKSVHKKSGPLRSEPTSVAAGNNVKMFPMVVALILVNLDMEAELDKVPTMASTPSAIFL